MSIELHIERLVIDAGVLGSERAEDVRAAIERELGRSLAGPGVTDVLRGIGATATLPATGLVPPSRPLESSSTRITSAVLQGLGLSTAARQGSATRHV